MYRGGKIDWSVDGGILRIGSVLTRYAVICMNS